MHVMYILIHVIFSHIRRKYIYITHIHVIYTYIIVYRHTQLIYTLHTTYIHHLIYTHIDLIVTNTYRIHTLIHDIYRPRTCEIYLIHSHIRLIYTYTHLTPYIQPTYTWYTPYIRPYATCIHPCTPYIQPYKIYIHIKYGNIHPSSPHSPPCIHLIFSLYSPLNT